jgi:hypothetical protein
MQFLDYLILSQPIRRYRILEVLNNLCTVKRFLCESSLDELISVGRVYRVESNPIIKSWKILSTCLGGNVGSRDHRLPGEG